ncbi:MAG: tRNA (adenosine(37)-N6)-dimethylallyltransferase MiaA [Propionibacteriaceae bacterium]|jgi:tRNA dimethylallyltransferase|nr:tRNA (adenosine(37)-N6)-dimethylallyltransferase MiaA [Propionibacteriaceae bacterium]
MSEHLPVVAINGPTASGKTGVSVSLALELGRRGIGAEIVNADSMLVYRGMDIGTAKPTVEERQGVPHHLIDIMDVTQTASVAEFQILARAAIGDCQSRSVVPLLVGGSALYVHAIVDEFAFPPTDPDVRAKYEQRLEQIGSQALWEELHAIDPKAAAGILPGNGRRIVRALEALELTGEFTSELPEPEYHFENVLQYGLGIERAELDARIEARVEKMWADGFVEEVKGLLPGIKEGKTASRAIGYRQILAFLDGEVTEAEAKEQTIVKTRQFSRKQLAWFRRDPRIVWGERSAAKIADQIERELNAS